MDTPATRCLVILNDGPYGSERARYALRLAATLAPRPPAPVDGVELGTMDVLSDLVLGADRVLTF